MSALRECPFCGRSPRVSWSRDNDVVNIRCEGWAYDCLGAGANCHDEAAAIAAWNRRARDAEAEALRARVERLEADAHLMALALTGQTPDGNTQEAAQATATQAKIDAAVARHLARALAVEVGE